MAAVILLEHLKGAAPGTGTAVSVVRFRSDDNDEQNMLAPVTVPQDVSAVTMEAVLPNTLAQFVAVDETSYFAVGDYAIIDSDTLNQEVIQLLAVTPSTISAVFRCAHAPGSTLRKVSASYPKVFQARISVAPTTGVNNLRFCRATALPAGVFDQWRIPVSYVPAASALPWISSSTNRYGMVGVTQQQVATGPWTAAGVIAYLEVQWLFTAAVKATPEVSYNLFWDES